MKLMAQHESSDHKRILSHASDSYALLLSACPSQILLTQTHLSTVSKIEAMNAIISRCSMYGDGETITMAQKQKAGHKLLGQLRQLIPALDGPDTTSYPTFTFPRLGGQASFVDVCFPNAKHLDLAMRSVLRLGGNDVRSVVCGITLPPTDVIVTFTQDSTTPLKATSEAMRTMVQHYNDAYCQKPAGRGSRSTSHRLNVGSGYKLSQPEQSASARWSDLGSSPISSRLPI